MFGSKGGGSIDEEVGRGDRANEDWITGASPNGFATVDTCTLQEKTYLMRGDSNFFLEGVYESCEVEYTRK